jgi:hypothetical protein
MIALEVMPRSSPVEASTGNVAVVAQTSTWLALKTTLAQKRSWKQTHYCWLNRHGHISAHKSLLQQKSNLKNQAGQSVFFGQAGMQCTRGRLILTHTCMQRYDCVQQAWPQQLRGLLQQTSKKAPFVIKHCSHRHIHKNSGRRVEALPGVVQACTERQRETASSREIGSR